MGNRENVTSRIVAYIRKNIHNGTWAVGDKLPSEHEMCKLLGASRTSVRNALQQYISLGILQSERGKGTFLVSTDLSVFGDEKTEEMSAASVVPIQDMKHLLQFRCLIEPEICRQVAPTASPELIARLEQLLETMKASVGSSHDFVQADMDFHLAICEALQNPVVTDVMQDISRRKIQNYHTLNTVVGYYGGIYYHTLLLDTFRKRNGKKAYSIMLEHLQRGISDLEVDDELPAQEPPAEDAGKDEIL